MERGLIQGVCLRGLSALLVLVCAVDCVGPGGAVGLSKPRMALYRCLLSEKHLRQYVRALQARSPDVEVLPIPWGVVWLEKEAVFGAGKYIDIDEEETIAELGTRMPAEWREVILTRGEAVEYFRLLLDGHTLEAMAKEMNFPDVDYSFGWSQMYWFLRSPMHRRVLGREILRILVEITQAHRAKPKWEGWRDGLSDMGPMLVQELADVPVEEWPEWYMKNAGKLYWDPIAEKYKLQLELR